jgi:hypothetical protein
MPGRAISRVQTAYPNAWEKHLRNLGVAAPADLPPAELARFTEHVFWLVRQTGIKDPAAWLAADRARVEATMAPVAPVQLEAPVEIVGDIPVQRDSVELEIPFSQATLPSDKNSPSGLREFLLISPISFNIGG